MWVGALCRALGEESCECVLSVRQGFAPQCFAVSRRRLLVPGLDDGAELALRSFVRDFVCLFRRVGCECALGIHIAVSTHMADQELITQYLNELVVSATELWHLNEKEEIFISLDDEDRTELSLRVWPGGKRISGRVANRQGKQEFELRIRPRHLEYRCPRAGAKGMLRASALERTQVAGPKDEASRVATLTRRLQHFSILQRLAEGIRSERRSTLPPPLSEAC